MRPDSYSRRCSVVVRERTRYRQRTTCGRKCERVRRDGVEFWWCPLHGKQEDDNWQTERL